MFNTLFPRQADNRYLGKRLGLWLFALVPLKVLMGLNIMFNAPDVARSADGIPIDTFAAQAAAAFAFVFAAWGLGQFILGLISLTVLLRYRSLVPLIFLALLVEQLGRIFLRLGWPVERIVTAPAAAINIAITAILLVGFGLSLWRSGAETSGV